MKDGTETQRLWTVRWGTCTALVWAQTMESAGLRVSHQAFDRKLTTEQVTMRPIKVHGDIHVLREATERDRQDFRDASIPVPA